MRIAIVSDAWHPQVNGVVRTLDQTRGELAGAGHEVRMITPQGRRCVPCPTYPSIPLAVLPGRSVLRELREFAPDAVHIATEGPLGHAARRHCMRLGFPFTTSFHTQFPEYIRARAPVPLALTYAYLRRFHGAATRTLAATPSVRSRLQARGFANVCLWSRGVDTTLFRPGDKHELIGPRPALLYVGRVAVEKNIEAFLSLEVPGTKYVIGDGPDRARLARRYPDTHFLGEKFGQNLAAYVRSADVFVFPSRTDTFGLVMLEAMASGVSVAAYPVTGPVDVVRDGETGCLHEDLAIAVQGALALDPKACVAYARARSWARCSAQFLGHLAPATVPFAATKPSQDLHSTFTERGQH